MVAGNGKGNKLAPGAHTVFLGPFRVYEPVDFSPLKLP